MNLYASVTGISNIDTININTTHDSSTTTAVVSCGSHSLTIGDAVTIDMGYSTSHGVLFTGYVKQIDRQVPNDLWTIQLNDVMIQAIDYFVAATDPNAPLTYQNITAETLVGNLMALAGLTNYTYEATSFTFGVNDKFEINQVAVHDYCRTISDLLTWNLWADGSGQVHFENRKPYVMLGTSGQPGDTVADVPNGITITDSDILSISYMKDTQKLRNRIVVYGNQGVFAEAKVSSPYLPVGFYKTAVLAAPGLIDTNAIAQTTADYNLVLLNRLTEAVSLEIVGNHNFAARTVTTLNSTKMGLSTGNWYVFACQHNHSSAGFITGLELRR